MAEYPHWFVVACSVLVCALGLWIAVKLVKVALWLFILGVLFVVGWAAVMHLFN